MTTSLETTDPLAQRLTELAASGRAVPEGLLAAAAEVDSRRLRRALRRLADDVRRGAFSTAGPADSMQRLTATLVSRSRGDVATPLVALERADAQVSQLRRRLFLAWLYPAAILVLSSACGLYMLTVTSHTYTEMYLEFELDESRQLEAYLLYFRLLLAAILIASVLTVAVAMCSRYLRVAWLERLYWRVPLIGAADRWLKLSVVCATMEQLLAHQVPYGEALRLSRASVRSTVLRRWLGQAATDVESGHPVGFALVRLGGHEEILSAIVGDDRGPRDPAAGWQVAQQYFIERASDRVQLVRAVVPVIGYLLVVAVVFSVLQASLAPLGDLARLISGLGG